MQPEVDPSVVESVLLFGDLRKLTSAQKVSYYASVCTSLGLNPLTQPFAYIILNGKEVLYAKREASEQLRKIHQISIDIKAREVIEGCYIVTATATMPSGRRDESTGAVAIEGTKGEQRANALLKAETKAKRRVTLSICGLGLLDETEIESIPAASLSGSSEQAVTIERPPVKEPEPEIVKPITEPVVEPESEYITNVQCGQLAKRFRESLRPELQQQAEELRHDALRALHFVDAYGNPSSTIIKKTEFASVGKHLVSFARNL